MRISVLLHDFSFILFLVGVVLLCSMKCTPAQIESLKETGWNTIDCAAHSSLGCAGQAAGACEAPSASGGGWGVYAECLASVSQGCMVKGLSRCALSGIASIFSGPLIAGGVGCGDDLSREQVDLCLGRRQIASQREAIEASAGCWRDVCGF